MFGKSKSKQKTEINPVILAALGVIEDSFADSVPLDEIIFCLRVDFKIKMDDKKLLSILKKAESAGYAARFRENWFLTTAGGKLADSFLENQVM